MTTLSRTLTVAAVAILSFPAIPAENSKLPPQFAGEWCLDSPKEAPTATYRLGRCNGNESSITIRATGFDTNEEMSCKIISAAKNKDSNYLVKFRCHGDKSAWTKNYWMSLELHINETDREP